MILENLSLGSIGDLDRSNEEIEMEINSKNSYNKEKYLNCGLYQFETAQSKIMSLAINIPCTKGEYVDIRFVERDNCNDDTMLLPIMCDTTSLKNNVKIEINPDGTVTGYTQCIHSSNEVSSGLNGGMSAVAEAGGSFSHAYTWGKEECGNSELQETTSEY